MTTTYSEFPDGNKLMQQLVDAKTSLFLTPDIDDPRKEMATVAIALKPLRVVDGMLVVTFDVKSTFCFTTQEVRILHHRKFAECLTRPDGQLGGLSYKPGSAEWALPLKFIEAKLPAKAMYVPPKFVKGELTRHYWTIENPDQFPWLKHYPKAMTTVEGGMHLERCIALCEERAGFYFYSDPDVAGMAPIQIPLVVTGHWGIEGNTIPLCVKLDFATLAKMPVNDEWAIDHLYRTLSRAGIRGDDVPAPVLTLPHVVFHHEPGKAYKDVRIMMEVQSTYQAFQDHVKAEYKIQRKQMEDARWGPRMQRYHETPVGMFAPSQDLLDEVYSFVMETVLYKFPLKVIGVTPMEVCGTPLMPILLLTYDKEASSATLENQTEYNDHYRKGLPVGPEIISIGCYCDERGAIRPHYWSVQYSLLFQTGTLRNKITQSSRDMEPLQGLTQTRAITGPDYLSLLSNKEKDNLWASLTPIDIADLYPKTIGIGNVPIPDLIAGYFLGAGVAADFTNLWNSLPPNSFAAKLMESHVRLLASPSKAVQTYHDIPEQNMHSKSSVTLNQLVSAGNMQSLDEQLVNERRQYCVSKGIDAAIFMHDLSPNFLYVIKGDGSYLARLLQENDQYVLEVAGGGQVEIDTPGTRSAKMTNMPYQFALGTTICIDYQGAVTLTSMLPSENPLMVLGEPAPLKEGAEINTIEGGTILPIVTFPNLDSHSEFVSEEEQALLDLERVRLGSQAMLVTKHGATLVPAKELSPTEQVHAMMKRVSETLAANGGRSGREANHSFIEESIREVGTLHEFVRNHADKSTTVHFQMENGEHMLRYDDNGRFSVHGLPHLIKYLPPARPFLVAEGTPLIGRSPLDRDLEGDTMNASTAAEAPIREGIVAMCKTAGQKLAIDIRRRAIGRPYTPVEEVVRRANVRAEANNPAASQLLKGELLDLDERCGFEFNEGLMTARFSTLDKVFCVLKCDWGSGWVIGLEETPHRKMYAGPVRETCAVSELKLMEGTTENVFVKGEIIHSSELKNVIQKALGMPIWEFTEVFSPGMGAESLDLSRVAEGFYGFEDIFGPLEKDEVIQAAQSMHQQPMTVKAILEAFIRSKGATNTIHQFMEDGVQGTVGMANELYACAASFKKSVKDGVTTLTIEYRDPQTEQETASRGLTMIKPMTNR